MGFALQKEQFFLEYQPQFELRTGNLIGFEALIRWNHTDLGIIEPNDFIYIAEENKLIHPLGKWVLEEICTQLVTWKLKGRELLPVTVNISYEQIMDPDFIPMLSQHVHEHNISSDLLEIEIAESFINVELEEILYGLDKLSMFGISISVDNFGKGNANIQYLRHFPVNRIKIDHSLIQTIGRDQKTEKIISMIILLAYNMGITVLAEGVENNLQADFLKKNQCDQAQGYHLAKPLAAENAGNLLVSAKKN